jgi:hypothetical protein
VLGGRLRHAESPVDYLEALKGSAKVVAAYGILFSASLVLSAV